MEIVLTDTPAIPKTYTGDPRQWPDGLYFSETVDFYVLVCNREWIKFPKGHGEWFCWSAGNEPETQYTRIPGYTGGIASITPEREEAGR